MNFRLKTIIFLLSGTVLWGSCTLFHPLPLGAARSKEPVQSIDRAGFSKFEGDYELVAVDTSMDRLDYAFTYRSPAAIRKLPGNGDYLHLSTSQFGMLEAILYNNGKIVKRKTIKGKLINDRFEFHSTHLSGKVIINLFAQQTNRIALSDNGDLLLDTNKGGIAFLFILPIPLSGAATDHYNLKFKRRK